MFRYFLTITLLICTAFANYAFSRPGEDSPRRPLHEFPRVIGQWKSIGDQFIDDDSMRVLKVDDYIMRTYVNLQGDTIGLYIGYFKNQHQGKGIHSPRQCLVGGGWTILRKSVYTVKTPNNRESDFKANLYLTGKGDHKDLYLWWYQSRGRSYSSEYLNLIYMVWDSLINGRTDGALIRINTTVKYNNFEAALERELYFTSLIYNLLSEYIPD